MNPLEALVHLINFLLPAWVVAAMMAVALRLLWRPPGLTWRHLALWGGVAGSVASVLALLLLARDGKMMGYALMIAAVAGVQWALTLRR